MSFVDPTTRVGETWVRPHDLEILVTPAEDAGEAMIKRIIHLGFEVRVDLVRADRERVWGPADAGPVRGARARGGQIVYLRTRQERVFA